MTVIVDIDHEAGDLTEYTTTVTDSGDLSVAAAAALAGTGYGLSCVIDDTTAIYGQFTLGTDNTAGKHRGRFYLDVNTLTMTLNDQFVIYRVENSSAALIMRIDLYKGGAGIYRIIGIIVNDAGSQTSTSAFLISDEPHYIEFYLQRAATNVSSDGSLEIWIDGVSQGSVTGIDNYDRYVNWRLLQLGACTGIEATTSGTFYLDQLVINDDGSEIGAYSAGIKIPVLLAQYRQRRQ